MNNINDKQKSYDSKEKKLQQLLKANIVMATYILISAFIIYYMFYKNIANSLSLGIVAGVMTATLIIGLNSIRVLLHLKK